MTEKLNILIVHSTTQDIQVVESAMNREQAERFDIVCSPTIESAIEDIATKDFSLVLLSCSLPDDLETRFAVRILEESSDIPVLPLYRLLRPRFTQVGSDRLDTESNQAEFDASARIILARALKNCLPDQQMKRQAKDIGAIGPATDAFNRLRASEERYALAIEGVQDGIWDWDLTLNSIYYSRQWQAMLGIEQASVSDDPEEWLGRVHPEDVVLLQRSLEDHLMQRRTYFRCEYRILHADGYYLWMLSRGGALRNDEGEPYRIVGSQIDISYHKQLEEALSQEKEQVSAVLKSMGDAVITTDPEGRILDFNPEAENLTGWSAQAAKNQPVSLVCQLVDAKTHEPIKSPSALAIEQNKVLSMSSHPMLISKQGDEIAVDNSAAPIRDKSGAVIGAVMVLRDVSVERDRAKQLAWQASHDPLTGLANRQYFVEQLELASHNPSRPHVVCYLDLDHFKIVNDTCGHAAGDELLRQVSTLLNDSTRQSDLIARLGGDEFGLIIYDCQPESAYKLACKICETIQKFRFLWKGKVFSIGVSIGLVPIPSEGVAAAQLMSLADAACYAAKNKGRNQVQVYSKENADVMQMSADFEWFSRITQAIEDDGFCLYAQEIRPCNADKDQEIIQEILLRLPNPRTQELLPPMAFIPPAERYDLMPKLDRWTIRRCFQQLETVNTPNVLYSINLSGDTLNDDNFVSFLQKTIDEFHVDPHRICFEITETTAIANLTQVASTILSLKQIGFRFALDDFGSGMSSFVYLKQLPVDYLKIDGLLVTEINKDKIALATLKSINDIGHIMGLTTVAEYVSDPEILKTVQDLKVDYMQGFAISKPRPFKPANQPPAKSALPKVALNAIR